MLARLPTDSRLALEQPIIESFIAEGMIRAPALDESKAKRLLELPAGRNTIGGDKQLEIHLVSPAQLHTVHLPGL